MYNHISAKAIGVPTQAACNFLNGLILKYITFGGIIFTHGIIGPPPSFPLQQMIFISANPNYISLWSLFLHLPT